MNILSFDIEEWALAKVRGYGDAERYAEYDAFKSYLQALGY